MEEKTINTWRTRFYFFDRYLIDMKVLSIKAEKQETFLAGLQPVVASFDFTSKSTKSVLHKLAQTQFSTGTVVTCTFNFKTL